MKYKWLNKEKNDKLILFFNGWGMNENVVKHLEPENYDIVMFYDYSDLETDFKIEKAYSETNIIAWSMGVMAASLFYQNFSPKKITAINGTVKPIDEKYGIHPKIYDLTIRNFNEENRNKFINNMFDDLTPSLKEGERSLENLKSELIALKTYKGDLNFTPDKVIISNNDKIIPTKNQCTFWNMKPNFKGGHCPFFCFSKWSELL